MIGVRESVGVAPAWRGGFGRLWTAAVVSRFGDSLRNAAMPLLAASLTDEPVLVALVSACGYVPWILFGLLGGAVADRVDQRRAMWTVDAVRAVVLGVFAVVVARGDASIGLLLAVAFTLTTLQTVFDNAATAFLPALLPQQALGSANARLQTGQQIAGGFVAAPLMPVLLAVGVAVPYGVDAATYAVATLLILSIRIPGGTAPVPSGSRARGLRADIGDGLRTLWRDPPLRALCLATTVCNVGVGALIATLVLHVTGWLGAGSTVYALALTSYSLGSVAGGFCAGRIAARFGRIRSVCLAGAVQFVPLLAIGTVRQVWVLLAGLVVFGLMGLVWNVNQVTLMQERSPSEMLGRMSAAFRTLTIGAAALGALLGGAAATAWGLNAPALCAAALVGLSVIVLLPVVRAADSSPADEEAF
ncbi:MFS transporter [Streptomyces triticagri]|uniref:MFS transporter n=1 Tax=Streptomyces triticagri TaxID=2293568 RepID=A0A372LVZ6_9ACTN|nr:MFS transporter [Streptomyces triticagri]RFU82455.1 MFS transporter [Streptomyces triticagri]